MFEGKEVRSLADCETSNEKRIEFSERIYRATYLSFANKRNFKNIYIYINTSLSNRDPSRRKKRCLLCAHGISLLTWRVLSFSLLRGVRDGHRDYRITGSRWAPFAFFSANIREPPPLHGWNIDETRRRLPLSPLHNFLALCSIKNSLYPSISELPIFPYILLIIGTKYGNSMAQRTKSLVRWEDKGNSR